MGKVMISGVAPQMTVPTVIPANFSDATWEQIIEACQTNTVPETWVVGNQKILTIGVNDHLVDIIGKNHDTYSSGGTAPLTFQLHNCYTKGIFNSTATNVGGWTDSVMRTQMLPQILNNMPTEIKTGIKEVNKLTSAGNVSSTINTTSDKLFLLSEVEIFGSTTYSFAGEGSQYDWYKAGNTKVKKVNGSAENWWERSPYSGNTNTFCAVGSDGTATYFSASANHGVSFAFCF